MSRTAFTSRSSGPLLSCAVSQTVEEVVKSLVDDRLAECEKIGSGNFYWSFPSKAYVQVGEPGGVGFPARAVLAFQDQSYNYY
jgi:hypothetical protein